MRRFAFEIVIGLVFALVGVAVMIGCAFDASTVSPSLVDDLADVATAYAVIFTEPGPDQQKLIREIQLARVAADTPALRKVIADLSTKRAATTVPTTAPSK